jgi:hypothetical protein
MSPSNGTILGNEPLGVKHEGSIAYRKSIGFCRFVPFRLKPRPLPSEKRGRLKRKIAIGGRG